MDKVISMQEMKPLSEAEGYMEEIKHRFAIAREALFLVRLDHTLQPNGKMCQATMDKVEEAFDLLS